VARVGGLDDVSGAVLPMPVVLGDGGCAGEGEQDQGEE
jgi:hypothetical protein